MQKLFDLNEKGKFSSEKLFLVQSKKFSHSLNETESGFPKHKIGIQKIRSIIIVMPLIFKRKVSLNWDKVFRHELSRMGRNANITRLHKFL